MPQTRETTKDFDQNAALKNEAAGRIAVPVLSILGAERADPETVMETIMEMAQRTLFVTELVPPDTRSSGG